MAGAYERLERLGESAGSILWRGRRGSDGTQVLLKCAKPAPGNAGSTWIRREYEVLGSLELPGIPKAIGYFSEPGDPCSPGIVLDDFLTGAPLATALEAKRPDRRVCLRIGIRIAKILEGMHAAGVIHTDVRPANIWAAEDGEDARFVDFSRAFFLDGREARDESVLPPGDWAYVSPEQTARMNRPMDHRADLYSLGATLYKILIGNPPFQSEDPLELAHSHAAREPKPPAEASPGVPPALSGIVMKLLRKAPEERYQSARGLRFDLEKCLALEGAPGGPADFELGTRDVSGRFSLPGKIFGREAEIEMLEALFRRMTESGLPASAFISGPPGIGKSSLVRELRERMAGRKNLFLAAKFDQYQSEIPYSVFAGAFRGLVQMILAGGEDEIARWKLRLSQALGINGAIVTEITPQFELILGPQPPVSPLPPFEAHNRFQFTLLRLLAAVARPESPLVLFLDDLQWADGASLLLVEQVLKHPETRHLMILGAYRYNEVGPSHPLTRLWASLRAAPGPEAAYQEIPLGPLDESSLRRILETAFRREPADCARLASLLLRKTGGNPFFAGQFLRKLREDGLIAFDFETGAWTWDPARIQEANVTDNVLDLMTERIRGLDEATRGILRTAACLGTEFDLGTLAIAMERPRAAVEAGLLRAVEQDLLAPHLGNLNVTGEKSGMAYRWLHDRIRQAAYSLTPEGELPALHLSIGRRLLRGRAPDRVGEDLFSIVNHLDLGLALIDDPEERLRAAELNLAAGRKAKAANAVASGIHYLSEGFGLLGPLPWDARADLAFALTLAWAECEFLSGRPDAAIGRAEILLARAPTRIDKASAFHLKHDAQLAMGDIFGAVATELQCIALFGIELAQRPPWEQVVAARDRIRRLLQGRPIEAIADLPPLDDPELEAVLLTTASSYFTDTNLYILHVSRMVELCLERGNTEGSILWYGSYGVVLSGFFGEYERGYQFAAAARALMEKRAAWAYRGKVHFFLGWVSYWTRPVGEAQGHFRDGVGAALESGDVIVAAYCGNTKLNASLAAGTPLPALLEESESPLAFARRAGFKDIEDVIVPLRQFARAMRGETVGLSSFDDADFNEQGFEASLTPFRLATMVCWYWILRLRACYLAGEYARALEAAGRARPLLPSSAAHAPLRDFHLYRALALAAACDPDSPQAKAEALREMREHEETLAGWSKANPGNFGHSSALVLAEKARLEGRDGEAARLFEESLARARAGVFLPDEALAYEVASRFYASRGFRAFSDLYLREAGARYERWGAGAKARLLAAPPAPREEAPPVPRAASGLPEHLDFLAVIKASQALSGEIFLDRLLESLMRIVLETAGAQKGALILGGEWSVAAEARVEETRVIVDLPRGKNPSAKTLPLSILNYVRHSRERVILGDAAEPGPYSSDDYLAREHPKSVLCLPILRQSETAGMLYLENNLAVHAFTAGRLTALELIAAQAAISLENAHLFEERSRAEEALRESQRLLQDLIDASSAIIYVKDLEGRYLLVNASLAEKFHASKREVIGKTDYDFLRRDVAAVIRANDQRALAARHALELEETVPQDGGTRAYISIKCPLFDKTGRPYAVCGISTDITDRKLVEEQLRQSQKMEAIGNLAGGIAHDFNNLLTAINGYSALALEEMEESNPYYKSMNEILKSGERAASLTKQLLAYSRKQVLQPKVWNLNIIVSEMEGLLKRLIGEDVDLVTVLKPDLGLAQVDRGQVEQIILNLIVNSRQAMPEGGKLTVETGNIYLDKAYQGTHLESSPGPHVMLAVTDTGTGMTAEVKTHIFEPFFTTKDVGKGTGLGLSVVYGIVKQSGGSISVYSEPGMGTTFRIYFPEVRTESAQPEESAPAAKPETPRGKETVLVAEDEIMVRQFTRHALESRGYTVLEAANGKEALRVLKDSSRPVQLVVTDIVMPEMGGVELARRIRSLYPSLPVLYVSGYAEQAVMHNGVAMSSENYLQKPFASSDLGRKVRDALDKAAHAIASDPRA